MRSRLAAPVLLGWLLLFSRDSRQPISDWKQLANFTNEYLCDDARDAYIHQTALEEIGALALAENQNPMRVAAYGKAVRRVQDRYRCRRE